MATDLATLIPALQRGLAVPGTFSTLFPDTLDSDLLGVLMDAFAEAQLDGMLLDYTYTDAGVVSGDLTRAEQAVVVIYAECRILVSEIRNRKTHKRYEAKGVIFEEDQSAQGLVELLKEMQARKKDVRLTASTLGVESAFAMADMYVLRAAEYGPGIEF